MRNPAEKMDSSPNGGRPQPIHDALKDERKSGYRQVRENLMASGTDQPGRESPVNGHNSRISASDTEKLISGTHLSPRSTKNRRFVDPCLLPHLLMGNTEGDSENCSPEGRLSARAPKYLQKCVHKKWLFIPIWGLLVKHTNLDVNARPIMLINVWNFLNMVS
ncbi:hypothetical protein KSP39_PZI014324 [Platanthera zijinensis]|uniref:Uncharacterized protein n=1 Tax=Platanthera zijinensis TaxID=2320716 RepID=A0AAP0BAL4_9ASPA